MKGYMNTSLDEEFQSGLTWRSFVAALYAVCIFTPAVIWLQLVTTGANLLGAIQISTILIFVELTRFSGKPLAKQEATIMFLVSTLASSTVFIQMIYGLYFVHSPITSMFGLTYEVPTWYSPSYFSEVWQLRTLWHPDWIAPIALYVVTQSLGTVGAYVFASMAREIFIEAERLPFPIQEVNARMVLVLTERSEESLSVLSGSALVALIYGILLYTVPTIAQSAGYPIRFIPIPWADFTSFMEPLMPGASFGIATDIMLIALGLILPPAISLPMLAGSMAIFIFGNWLTVRLGITMWAEHYTPGMDFTKIYQESTLYLWANPIIGMGFAMGLVPLLLRPRLVVNALRALGGGLKSTKERISGGTLSPKLLFALLIAVGSLFILIYYILVPGFPIWAMIVWEYPLMFLMMLVTVRVLGETGIEWMMPNMQQLLVLASGYQGVKGWFIPLNMHPGTHWTATFRLCQLTKTDTVSWIKAYFIVFPISLLMGIVYVGAFWAVSPIPSATYPMPAITWPVTAMYQALWITRPERFFKPDLILYSFLFMLGFGSLMHFSRLPISVTGLFVGLTTPIPSIFTIFLGTVIGKIIALRVGRETYNRTKLTLAAGLMLGEGLAIIMGAAGALIQRAIWARPY